MATEKIYYAVIILLCAASMLLSPFFFIRRGRPEARRPVRWKAVVLSNLIMIAALIVIWWKWF